MNLEHLNDEFYIGYEGYPEICFLSEKGNDRWILKLWNGYFETLVDLLCTGNAFQEYEIIQEFTKREGWYDNSPWEINNIPEAIKLFSLYDASINDDEEVKGVLVDLPIVQNEILSFLVRAETEAHRAYLSYE